MKIKKIVGAVVAVIGIALILVSFYAMSKVASAQGTVNAIEGVVSKNPAAKMAGNQVNAKIDNYRILSQRCLFGGIILLVIGAGTVIICKKHKKKRR